ncbi:MAG: hypothetical protein M1838_005846 [Thelocarpon superellum]|nr:MAG: hypothetical protein M1838_005846 [Thelocarpon superellum]
MARGPVDRAGQAPLQDTAKIEKTRPIASGAEDGRLLDWNEIQCIKSVLQAHNDTGIRDGLCQHTEDLTSKLVNIHSHLFGAALFFAFPAYYFLKHPYFQDAKPADFIVFSTFFFGVGICFFLSSTFHTVSNHSPRVNVIGNQLDYLGIVILMWGSTIPSVYYGYYCDPNLQKLYWAMVTVLAAACTITTLAPTFRHPTLRPWRAVMYTGLGFSFLIPMLHGLIIYGWRVQNYRMSLSWMGIMTLFNLTGAVIYALRAPERYLPRRYDIVGSSHQILHFMVIFAGITHLVGLLEALKHVREGTVPCLA